MRRSPDRDILVVGAGAAGLTAALSCAPRSVTLLTKARLGGEGGGGATAWAQGGVASAVGDDDTPALHAADTLAAGAGLNDARIVGLLTSEGPARVRALLELGARFDRDGAGRLRLGREAAHSRRRILHAHGDATGAEIVRTLIAAVRRTPSIRVVDDVFALDLAVEQGRVAGVVALDRAGRRWLHGAGAVVLATGGPGQLFLHTTNPPEATGDGLAMAARAGARLVDLEFVQFHPTALAVAGGAGEPMPLLTEALRGEGALLLDERGVRFMASEHPSGELAPRDVVARAIWRRLSEGRKVFLDASAALGDRFPERFPTVYALCRRHGLDPRREPIPVAPAAHYHMGGVAVDARGRTSLPGLWACGEVAATGAHGANRLASNSLLEALVFGDRVASDLRGALDGAEGADAAWCEPRLCRPPGEEEPESPQPSPDHPAATAALALRRLMWERVGVVRDGAALETALNELEGMAGRAAAPESISTWEAGEARNLLAVGRLVAAAALARRESRGAHFRSDFPSQERAWRNRLFVVAEGGGEPRFEAVLHPAGQPQAVPAGVAEPRADRLRPGSAPARSSLLT
ncbi:MAG TPA: L-aspartate oxidase [Thermoanaerobaculia bacterium]|nr:L-aspartate oxidase [Thermoanaerobaculia bacterium]